MFFYLFRNRLFCLIRQKNLFIFSLGLPILLALLFFFGLNNLSERENSTIGLGIIGNENTLTNYFKNIVKEDGTSLFYLKLTDEWEGEELLKKGDVKGLVKAGEVPTLFALEEGYDQAIINYYLVRYNWLKNIQKVNNQSQLTIDDITNNGYDAIVNRVSNVLPDRNQIFFYNLLVLILLLGARLGFSEVKIILQERSPIGLRILNAPKSRSSICFSNLLAAFTIHITGVVLCLTFVTQVLRINLLIHIIPLIIISFATSIFGFSIGTFICVIIKANNKVRSTILNLFLMLGSITAGIFD
ncbi:MAG: hypothetical protein K0S61_3921, partial [Anaerocolumna sp.]|nr:hypothetical protein [Anaerocolumna sp.]